MISRIISKRVTVIYDPIACKNPWKSLNDELRCCLGFLARTQETIQTGAADVSFNF